MRSADYDRVGGIPPFEKLFFADDALWLSLLSGSCKMADPENIFPSAFTRTANRRRCHLFGLLRSSD
jgi:hypothetical protein